MLQKQSAFFFLLTNGGPHRFGRGLGYVEVYEVSWPVEWAPETVLVRVVFGGPANGALRQSGSSAWIAYLVAKAVAMSHRRAEKKLSVGAATARVAA